MNRVRDLLESAQLNNWCTKFHCTTCGATEFRMAIAQLLEGGEERFAKDLATALSGTRTATQQELLFDRQELPFSIDRDGALFMLLDYVESEQHFDRVLSAWLPRIHEHVRLADLVLFHYVRRGAFLAPMSIDVAGAWRAKCVDIAVMTRDESLVESLICTLGHEYKRYPVLAQIIEDLNLVSPRVRKALRRLGVP